MQHVRGINLTVELGEYGAEAWCQYETAEEQNQNNRLFTETTTSMFTMLAPWPDEHGATGIHQSRQNLQVTLGGRKVVILRNDATR